MPRTAWSAHHSGRKTLPAAIRNKENATAETIENNVRKLIIDETPINPKYYEKMSALLDR
ncbi:MAG TPA: hypothetical protein VEB21_07155 [Terriglobales bacterium]|nr:hypothetical protein [Terriglobales bacterium]